MKRFNAILGLTLLACATSIAWSQPPQGRGGPGGFGFGGPGPGGAREDIKLVEKFDKNEDGWLNQAERAQARQEAKSQAGNQRRGGMGRRPGGGPGRNNRPAAKQGASIKPDDVKQYSTETLYDHTVLRTLFFEFENDDWEQELEDFHGTDVDVPAKLTVDGKVYSNVGVRFRGQSSYGMVPTGYKRSFNVSLDLADQDQRLLGYKTLNLLNSAGDPSFMSTVLYSHIANQFLPAPKANHVAVVINGRSWGVYVNVQQFNKDFIAEHFENTKGTRWKAAGNPGADAGLRYLGDDLEPYQQRFEMKSSDGKKAWKSLVDLCQTLNETPTENLKSELASKLDIDQAIKFLALDVALVNSDGYWTRASDYSLFLDSDKQFHIFPHDMNEAFSGSRGPGGPGGPGGPPPRGLFGFGGPPPGAPGGPPAGGPPERDQTGRSPGDGPRGRFPGQPGQFDNSQPGAGGPPQDQRRSGGRRRGGPGGPGGHGSVTLDPLVAIDNPRMPLHSKLLAVPELREQYLARIKEIAQQSMDWDQLEPFVADQVKLIEQAVATDTRKLDTTEAFRQATYLGKPNSESTSLRAFLQQRREYLLQGKSK